jgi:hypothetical protein
MEKKMEFLNCSTCGEIIYSDGHAIEIDNDSQLIICDKCHKKSRRFVLQLCMGCFTCYWHKKVAGMDVAAFLYKRTANCHSCKEK